MNEADLRQLTETINQKSELDSALREFARTLHVFKESLIHEGFSGSEALTLTVAYVASALGGHNGKN